jgi:hypothetical protein
MISFSLTRLGWTTGVLSRLFVAAVGVAALVLAIYRAPGWLASWNAGVAVGAVGIASALLLAAIAIAAYGNARAVKRVATEVALLVLALLAAEFVLVARAPEDWSDNPVVQQMTARERAATAEGLVYDGRLPADVVSELRSQGQAAVPGFAQQVTATPEIARAVLERGLLPLSNVSSTNVVECNEGNGYFVFRSDEFGFNNPPGLASGPVDIAIIGASLALGHCVPPTTSAVDRIRHRFPRTANLGIAGSRVLSNLAVFREYVKPLEPSVVVWFVNLNYTEAREERSQPLLTRYLNDATFSQHLRERQPDVDAFVRDLVVPLRLGRDDVVRKERDDLALPLERVVKLREVRSLIDFGSVLRPAPPAPDLSHFRRALAQVVDTTRGWNGQVILVLLPSYATVTQSAQSVARYEAILDAVDPSQVGLVDGVALFDGQPDKPSLFTLRIDNHPSERGHAVLAEAVIAAIESRTRL